MAVVKLTRENFDQEVLKAGGPVLVDFWASWCGPCKALMPLIEELGEEARDFKVCKLDVDEESEIAGQYHVMGVPTLMVFRDGKAQNRLVGAQKKDTILKAVKLS